MGGTCKNMLRSDTLDEGMLQKGFRHVLATPYVGNFHQVKVAGVSGGHDVVPGDNFQAGVSFQGSRLDVPRSGLRPVEPAELDYELIGHLPDTVDHV